MKAKITLFTLITFFTFNHLIAQFAPVTSCLTNGDAHAIFFINPDTGFVAGESSGNGVIQKTTDGGQSWSNVYTSTTGLEWVIDITFVNATTGFAVGVNGTILKTVDGGASWSHQSISNIYKFKAVYFTDQTTAYIVGDGTTEGPIYKTTDGGVSWIPKTSGAVSFLNDVFFIADTGYAVGDYDLLKTIDGGTTWNNVAPTNTDELRAIYCTDANTCFVLANGIRKTDNGGTTWTSCSLPQLSTQYIYSLKSIYFTDADTGFATGMYIDTSNFTGAGIILKTIDAGQTWHNINDPGGVVMSSINFVDSQIGYATGFDGATLKTTNAGGAFSGILPIAEKENKMNIYPNPASVIVTLNIDNINNADLTLNIYNVIGTLVKTEILKQKNSQINIGDLSNGVYMISIKSKDLNENQKLIIQR